MFLSGRRGKTVYGPAHQSNLEFLYRANGATYDASLRDSLRHLSVGTLVSGETVTSSAFAVNHSHSLSGTAITMNIDQDKCEFALRGRGSSPTDCRNGRIRFIAPAITSSDARTTLYNQACVTPQGQQGRLCVFTAGNHGFNREGWVFYRSGSERFAYSVEVLQRAVATLTADPVKDYFDDSLYLRRDSYNLVNEGFRAGVTASFSGHYLVVVALDRGRVDRLAEYSNACGLAFQHCLAAPGDISFFLCGPDDVDTFGDGICSGSAAGTSFAAPLVTGAAALLKSTYPNLLAPVVSTILLTTATDLGEPGVDQEFGWGRLDIGKSLGPLGGLRTLSGSPLRDTTVASSPAIDAALGTSSATFGMFDMHMRPFLHSVASRVSSPRANPEAAISDMMHSSASLMGMDPSRRMGLVGTGSPRGGSFANNFALKGSRTWFTEVGLESCALTCPTRRDVHAAALVPSTALAWTEHNRAVTGGRLGLVFEAGLKEDMGFSYTSSGMFYAAEAGDALLRLEVGTMDESETFMGSEFGGALDVHPGNGQYVSAQLGMPVGEGAFSAGYTLGRSGSGLVPGSYLTEVKDAVYDAYRMAVGGKDWELHYTTPLVARSGGVRVESIGGYAGDNGEWSIVPTENGAAVIGEPSPEGWKYRQDSHWIEFGNRKRERRVGLTMSSAARKGEYLFGVEHVSNSPRKSYDGDEIRSFVTYSLEF